MKTRLARGATFAVVAITALCGSPAAFAQGTNTTIAISNTGPGSNNTVTASNTETCIVTNTNNVAVNASSNQQATTGSVNVSGNTTAGSAWGQWDPDMWAAQGYSYDQWYSALSAHLGEIQANWGKQAPATISSGNATNNNTVGAAVAIANNGCAPGAGSPGGPGTQFSVNPSGSVLGSTTALGANGMGTGSGAGGSGSGGSILGISNPYSVNGATGTGAGTGGSSSNPGTPGTPGTPSGGSGGCAAGINQTGPSSNNQIACNNTVTNTTTNNNTVTGTTTSTQTATSGSTNESSNTSAGGAGSGDSSNQNNSAFDFSVAN